MELHLVNDVRRDGTKIERRAYIVVRIDDMAPGTREREPFDICDRGIAEAVEHDSAIDQRRRDNEGDTELRPISARRMTFHIVGLAKRAADLFADLDGHGFDIRGPHTLFVEQYECRVGIRMRTLTTGIGLVRQLSGVP